MVAEPVPAGRLLFIFLFLIPGYSTVWFFLWVGKPPVSLDSFDKTVISVLFSGISLAVITAGYFYIENPVDFDPASLSLFQLALGFLLQVLLNVAMGLLGGVLYDRRRDEDEVYHPNLWVKTVRDEEGVLSVRVETISGNTFSGQVDRYDRTEGTPALLLTNYQEVTTAAGGDEEVESRDGSLYISENDISRIQILDDRALD